MNFKNNIIPCFSHSILGLARRNRATPTMTISITHVNASMNENRLTEETAACTAGWMTEVSWVKGVRRYPAVGSGASVSDVYDVFCVQARKILWKQILFSTKWTGIEVRCMQAWYSLTLDICWCRTLNKKHSHCFSQRALQFSGSQKWSLSVVNLVAQSLEGSG